MTTRMGEAAEEDAGPDDEALARYNRFYPPTSEAAPQPLVFDELIEDVLRNGGVLIGERHFKARHLENENRIVAALLGRKPKSRPLSVVLEPGMDLPEPLAQTDAPYSVALSWSREFHTCHWENGVNLTLEQDNRWTAHAVCARREAEPDGLVVCIVGNAHLCGTRSTQFFCLNEGFSPVVIIQDHDLGSIRVSPWLAYLD